MSHTFETERGVRRMVSLPAPTFSKRKDDEFRHLRIGKLREEKVAGKFRTEHPAFLHHVPLHKCVPYLGDFGDAASRLDRIKRCLRRTKVAEDRSAGMPRE